MSKGGLGSTGEAFAAESRNLAADLRGRFRSCNTVPTGLALINIWEIQVQKRMVTNQEVAGTRQGSLTCATGA